MIDSTVLTDIADKSYLLSLLEGKDLQLIYRGSRDGWNYRDFHQRCDNKGPTVTLFKTSTGKRCGGYAGVSWDTCGKYKTCDKSFLISFDLQRHFPVKQADNAIYCASASGPNFGNCNLAAKDEPFNGDKKCVTNFSQT